MLKTKNCKQAGSLLHCSSAIQCTCLPVHNPLQNEHSIAAPFTFLQQCHCAGMNDRHNCLLWGSLNRGRSQEHKAGKYDRLFKKKSFSFTNTQIRSTVEPIFRFQSQQFDLFLGLIHKGVSNCTPVWSASFTCMKCTGVPCILCRQPNFHMGTITVCVWGQVPARLPKWDQGLGLYERDFLHVETCNTCAYCAGLWVLCMGVRTDTCEWGLKSWAQLVILFLDPGFNCSIYFLILG